MIESVKELRAELILYTLGNTAIFHQSKVNVVGPRPFKDVGRCGASQASGTIVGRCKKAGRIEELSECSATPHVTAGPHIGILRPADQIYTIAKVVVASKDACWKSADKSSVAGEFPAPQNLASKTALSLEER